MLQTKTNYLDAVNKAKKPRPTAAVLYGPPGIGKTSIGAQMAAPIFLIDRNEQGVETLRNQDLIPPETAVLPVAEDWESVLEMVNQLAAGGHEYKTLVVDTIGGIEWLCHTHVCETKFGGKWGDDGFASFQRGYELALPEWKRILTAFDKCRDAGMGVMLLGHSVVKPHRDPAGADFDRYVPALHHKTWGITHRWADMILFCNYDNTAQKDKAGRAKGRTGEPLMWTKYSAAFDAKNRHNLPECIPMGTSAREAFGNLRNALTEARKKGE